VSRAGRGRGTAEAHLARAEAAAERAARPGTARDRAGWARVAAAEAAAAVQLAPGSRVAWLARLAARRARLASAPLASPAERPERAG
jgi:hypothetical protein